MLEENSKRKILEILKNEFSFDEEIHMAKVGKYLHDNGAGPEVYGYKKMKKYFQDLKEIMTLQERIMNGVPQTIIVLHEYEEPKIPFQSERQKEKEPIQDQAAVNPEKEFGDATYPKRLQDFVFIPNKVLGCLDRMASDVSMEGRTAIQVLEEAYDRAIEDQSMEVGEQRLQFFTGVYTEQQEPLYAGLSPNKLQTEQKWALTRIYTQTQKKELQKEKTNQIVDKKSALEELVLLPDKTVNLIKRLVTAEKLKGLTPKELLTRAYNRAYKESAIQELPDQMNFPLYIQTKWGENLQAVCRLNRYPNQQKWALTYIGSKDSPIKDQNEKTETVKEEANLSKNTVSRERRESVPGKMLESFAYLGNWNNVLLELAEMALPEQWDFDVETKKSYYILRQYLCYTFYRLKKEGKICISAGGDFAAFNTGLVSRMYEDIYACFVPNEETSALKWKLDGFCVAGERGNGKLLVKYFSPLPQAARYYKELKDLLYDPERQLIADYNHILIENIDRLPMEFIIQECFSDRKAVALATQAGKEINIRQRKRICRELSEYISKQPRLVTRLRNRLDDAIDLAKKQCRWNYKTALPLYYPKGNCMSLMLPLSLQDDAKVDVAFVVQLTESGNYQGQTILTLPQAYLDARLLSRLNNEWLNTQKAIGLMDLEDPDDIGVMVES